jgi:exodeoxyribonuclease V gamma subunit
MEALQAQFHHLLKVAPLTSIFEKEVVLVQSPGMSQWLKIGLSQQLGLAAQVDFPLPSSFIWRLYQQLLPNVPSESAFNKPNLAWKLFSILPQCINEPLYLPLKNYLDGDLEGQKLFALCEKIADVYDQYLMYRPHWIGHWENGKDELDDVDVSISPWQPDLWRRLTQFSQDLGQNKFHRANMQDELLNALEKVSAEILPKRISLFGISAIANSQLAVFEALSKKTEVFLFFFNPSEHFWGDIVDEKTAAKISAKYAKMPLIEAHHNKQKAPDTEYYFIGNPLLSSWGKLGRDYFEQLVQLDAQWLDGFVDDFEDTLLGKIQSEIYQLAFKGESLIDDKSWFIVDEGKIPVDEHDTSIVINDCHTPLREVERLHDYLLNLLNNDPTLTPKDIIIMMPDVGVYSPFVESVFGGAQNTERFIPYALADLAIEQENPVLSSFANLANLPFSRFGVSDILDLLQVQQIADKFAFEEHEYEQIQYWLESVGVKWGVNAQHKVDFDLPSLPLNTWMHGLNRLLLGIAQRDEFIEFNGIYSADEVEGMALDTLNKLVHFIETLLMFKARLSEDASLITKANILNELIASIYASQNDENWDLMLLQNVLQNLRKHHENGDYQGKVSQQVVSYLVQQGIQEKGVGQRFLVGKANFCTLMPMRAIPFKVVCILGLNDADYPRNVQPIGFDLVQYSQKQKGDRSRKLDDRYLFLEALLSARDTLYMSYIGRSCRDNQKRMPSTLLSELLEYIQRSFTLNNEEDAPLEANTVSNEQMLSKIISQQHLQPFNLQYYLKDQNLSTSPIETKARKAQQINSIHSYNPTWLPNSAIAPGTPSPLEVSVSVSDQIELDSFVRAVCNAQESFYQQTLGLRLPNVGEVAKDDEVFQTNELHRYFYLDEILEANLSNVSLNTQQLLQRGKLPLAQVGQLKLNEIISRVEGITQVIKAELKDSKQPPIEVVMKLENTEIVGWLSNVYGAKSEARQVFYRPSSVKPKDLISAFIYHLAAQVSAHQVSTIVIGLDNRYEFSPVETSTAQKLLLDWFSLYKDSRKQPVAFFPVSSFEYIKKGDFDSASRKFSSSFKGFAESDNPYIRLDAQSLRDCETEFIAWSTLLIKPILQHAKEVSHADA